MIQSLKILDKESSTILKLIDLSKDIEVYFNWGGVSFSTKNQEYQPKDGFSRYRKLDHIFIAFDSNTFNENDIDKIEEYNFTREENLYLDELDKNVNLIINSGLSGFLLWDSIKAGIEKRDLD